MNDAIGRAFEACKRYFEHCERTTISTRGCDSDIMMSVRMSLKKEAKEALLAVEEEKTYNTRCRQEATRSVIFLFQIKQLNLVGYPHAEDGEYCHDGDGVILGDTIGNEWRPRDDAEYLTTEQLETMETDEGGPCVVTHWQTLGVFMSRVEAEEYGRKTDHRYKDGWRVYGVPAEGHLEHLLRLT